VLEHVESAEADRLVLELRDAYPEEADLASLRRSVTLDRRPQGGRVELVDEVTFANAIATFESALVTFAHVQIEPSRVRLHGENAQAIVEFDPESTGVRVETLPQVDLMSGPRDLQRVLFSLRDPIRTGSIRLTISVTSA
jgi:hypothetical protein